MTVAHRAPRVTPSAKPAAVVPPAISIALIEESRLVREGLATLINQQPGLRVVCATAMDQPRPNLTKSPDVVLLDLGARKGDSLRVAADARRDYPGAKVIIMDLLPAHEEIVEFVNAGVSGFIMKDASLEDLVSTIRTVVGGASVLPLTMVNTLFSQIARETVVRARPDALESVKMTPRERQVIKLIAEGMSNKEIAATLHVAIHTVKSHVRNVMEKLALHSRLQIAAYVHSESKSPPHGV